MWSNDQQEQDPATQCSFCGKRPDQINQLTIGPSGTAICTDCVDLYRKHLTEMAGILTDIKQLIQICPCCDTHSPASHRYCFNCGFRYPQEA